MGYRAAEEHRGQGSGAGDQAAEQPRGVRCFEAGHRKVRGSLGTGEESGEWGSRTGDHPEAEGSNTGTSPSKGPATPGPLPHVAGSSRHAGRCLPALGGCQWPGPVSLRLVPARGGSCGVSHRQENDCIRNGAVFPTGALGKSCSRFPPSIASLSSAMEREASVSISSLVPTSASTSPTATFKEELLCPICYDPFREAVTLGCGHNFCKGCVTRSWEHGAHVCPVCKERSSLDDLRINHTLNNLVEKILKEERQRRGQAAALCPLHHQEAKLFCLEDKELACFACQSSKQHEGHKLRPVQETATDFRAKLKNMETSLRDKVKDFGTAHRAYESILKHNQAEVTQLREQIKQEFEKLHSFLRAEEQALLDELQEEVQHKQDFIEGKMKQLLESCHTLLNEAKQLQNDLKEDDYTFLMAHKNRKRRIACTAEEPEGMPVGMLFDVAKYLGSLQYNVWKKMLNIITVVPFTFNPNSAAGWLEVSEDLTSVTNRGYKMLVENPERFTSAPCILGSRSFLDGFHTWEVDLGGVTNWRVGVARPPSGAQWTFHHDARSGFWYIYHLPGIDIEMDRASNATRLETALGSVKRIRVELDCDEGELSFYDADRRAHIYTFHEKFSTAVYPYFYVGPAAVGAVHEPLRICPLRVRVQEDVSV
ncbi:E3 ubiquitin-protein ligase TRIM35 isoform X2 [Dryobates pubescens]|uniref:E3 ubiquitin-protein ligase TRIM35 isoform X2 n=1 Tax=Dryobates pubescens TaxID=118200 RepID=UPI0023B97011|nr:E3 ubiquitin-protein ligase TRIM35 isoform X2 [Dryobates pubescens]